MLNIGIAGPISIRPFARELRCTDDSGPALPAGLGGTPLEHLVRALLARGYPIVVFTLDPAVPSEVILEGSRIRFCIGPYRARHRARDLFSAERAWMAEAMRREAPDLVHAHWTYEFAMAALDSGRPTLVTAHDAPLRVLRFTPDPYRLVRLLMSGRVARRAPHLTAVSPYVARHFRRWLGYRRPIAVVPNPLPDEIFALGNDDGARSPKSPFTVATILSGWSGLKNGAAALRAMALVRKQLPQARLLMFGQHYASGGPAEIWSRTRRLTEGVEFGGALPNSELLRRLRHEAHVLLHPSREESFGMPVAEAMALGLAVVGGQSSGGVPWVLDEGRVGLLVDVKSPAALARGLLDLARDPQLRTRLGLAARDSAWRRFRSAAVAVQYEALYEQLLHSSAHADHRSGFEIACDEC